MDIDSFYNGSAYITFYRSDFKDAYKFESYCRFMRKPTDCDILRIYVVNGEPESEINENDPDEPNEYEEIE